MASESLAAAIASVRAKAEAIRHEIHQDPEPGFEEKRTHERIKAELARIGITATKTLAGTGIIADVEGTGDDTTNGGGAARTVHCVALRADMDALRMTEAQNGLPYRSKNEGVAHMCGHDGHMATLLATAELLMRARARLPKGTKVRLLFQPAEEGPGGALPMIKEGCLDGVDEVYGYHNWPAVPLGQVSVKAGALMASVSDFDIEIVGRGGHASTPHLCVDPIVAASHFVTATQTIVSRSVPSSANAVVTIAAFQAGTTTNVIPDSVKMLGTIRHVSPEVNDVITTRLTDLANHTSEAFGCTAHINIIPTYPVLMNHARETAHVQRIAASIVGASNVTDSDLPKMGAEDFAYYLQHRPGCFYFLGGAESGRSNAVCHSTKYDYNDNLLPLSIEMFVRIVEDRLAVRLYA